jgi:hypothetical protein
MWNLTKTNRTSSKQKCKECHTPVKPIWVDDPKIADTWFWQECRVCGGPVCDDCCDPTDLDDFGDTICITCLSGEVMQANKSKGE